MINGHLSFGPHLPHTATDSILKSGGDAVTEPCLGFFAFVHGTDCADVTLHFWYSLEAQPEVEQEKKFRYVAYKGKNGQFSWYTEPSESPENYCKRFYKP
jgi:hypothetical protein